MKIRFFSVKAVKKFQTIPKYGRYGKVLDKVVFHYRDGSSSTFSKDEIEPILELINDLKK